MTADRKNVQLQEFRGLECRACGCRHFLTVYTRPKANGQIMRRKECRHCGKRIVTYEHQ